MVDFDCLKFFKEELKHDSAVIRIGAIKRLNLIASALGPQKTVSELIPYLSKQVLQEEPLCYDEELLYNIAQQCSVLSDYVAGRDEVLVVPLELLAAQEETVIRDGAIFSFCKIIEKCPALAPEHLVPAVHRLATNADSFTARVSACALLPTAYRFASEDQKPALREEYARLCVDDAPMVRRAAANRMRDLVAVCDKQVVLSDMVRIFKQLSLEDTQDTIRVACVHAALVIAKMFSMEENRMHVLAVVRDAAEDRSWRVRLTVAKLFDQLCAAFGREIMASDLMASLDHLVKDSELEVRKEAVRVLEPCLKLQHPLTSEQLQRHILPQFKALAIDSAQPVRAALAQVLGPVAKALGSDVTHAELLDLMVDLMKDEMHDVRINMASHAGLLCEVLGVKTFLNSFLGMLESLIMDNHWRIRQRVVEQVPKLAKHFGIELFQTKLETLFLSSLRDSVYSVREVTVDHLKEVTDTFGPEWTVEHLLPKLLEQYSQSTGYAYRVTTLHVFPRVAGSMTPEQVMQFLIPVLTKATKDAVPNVRLCACQNIISMVENHNLGVAAINTVIKPTLLELEQDSDTDVQYYAHLALSGCGL